MQKQTVLRGSSNGSSHLAYAAAVLVLLIGVLLVPEVAVGAQVRSYSGVSFGPEGASSATAFADVSAITVDQSTGDVYVYDAEGGTGGLGAIYKFDELGEPVAFAALAGSNIIQEVGASAPRPGENEIAVAPPGAPGGTAGDIYLAGGSGSLQVYGADGKKAGTLEASAPVGGVAVDPAGHIFLAIFPSTIEEYLPSANPPISADLVRSGTVHPEFGAIGNVAVDGHGGVYAMRRDGQELFILAGLEDQSPISENLAQFGNAPTIAADPLSGHLFLPQTETLSTPARVAEYEMLGNVIGTFGESDFVDAPLGPNGIATRSLTEKVYVGDSGSRRIKIFGRPVILPTTNGVDAGTDAATLRGQVNPSGAEVTGCQFEYGLFASEEFEGEVPCSPPAAGLPIDSTFHPVSAAINGLQTNTKYRFRISIATTNGPARSSVEAFETVGIPVVSEVTARNATQTSAELTAKIDPRGFGNATYFVEWGSTPALENRIPATGSSPLDSTTPRTVTIPIAGLTERTLYHYRIDVTTIDGGTTRTLDQTFETTNNCGLPENRCFELVSPPTIGPYSSPGKGASDPEITYQVSREPGALAYTVENGLPGATNGSQVSYVARRRSDSWENLQLSAPLLDRNSLAGNGSEVFSLSPTLSCSVLRSQQLLTEDAGVIASHELGAESLYVGTPAAPYKAVTTRTPLNLDDLSSGSTFIPDGQSGDCSTVIFETNAEYPVADPPDTSAGGRPIYEWRGGRLTVASSVPNGLGGETSVVARVGNDQAYLGAVSEDASRVFFTAERLTAPNNDEIGKPGLFVREGGSRTRDVSASATSVPDVNPAFKYATPSGDRVFFTAEAGLTAESSASGTDLYEYDLPEAKLTDLSVSSDGPANVMGLVGSSSSGAHVYFAAEGQLVAHRGSTLAQNRADETVSIYGAEGGAFEYVGRALKSELGFLTTNQSQGFRSRVTTSGSAIVFETAANIVGYESGSPLAPQVYLYNADDQGGGALCLSCRPDGQRSVAARPANQRVFQPLLTLDNNNRSYLPNLSEVDGQPVAVFYSRDPLAAGATEGQTGLYEWIHNQLFMVQAEPPGLREPESRGLANLEEESHLRFLGTNRDATDLYFAVPKALVTQAQESRWGVYDARVGGGIPYVPPQEQSCDAAEEGSCQGASSPAGAVPSPATSSAGRPGKTSHKHHKKKHHKKKHHKKKHHKKKHHKKRHSQSRRVTRSWGRR